MGDNIVVVKNLSKKYGKFFALSNISLCIPKGKTVGLIGPNGAGKTSFLKILSGLITPTEGEVYIAGNDLSTNTVFAKESVAIMLEDNPLPDHMKVGEYLRFRAALKGIKDVRKAAENIMRKCNLYYEARYKMIKCLSKGYRQRVGIADALLGNRPLIILDEPTIGLDPRQIINIRKTLVDFSSSRTFIISSHILSELETICDYYIMINDGHIVSTGTFDEITTRECALKFKYYASIDCIYPKNDMIHFLKKNNFSFSIKVDTFKNLRGVYLNSNTLSYKDIACLFACYFNEHLISFGKNYGSLEDAFLYATKRSYDDF